MKSRYLILCAVLSILGDAFQAPVPLSPTTVATQLPSPLTTLRAGHLHEFWRKPRTEAEVKKHVYDCLNDIAYIDDEQEDDAYNLKPRVTVISAEPPLVLIHDFLSETMCDEIIQTAKNTGNMQLSTLGNKQTTSQIRTSSTVWLKDTDCAGPLRLIADKVASISGLPPAHMENLQVVRYEPGQEFKLHTDHLDSFNDLECRGRMATCLIYLAQPTSGGETWFPCVDEDNDELRIPVTKGSAVFFWNTVQRPGCEDYTPNMFLNADLRLRHAGLPVGDDSTQEKWICNRWIHPIDFGAGVRGL